MNTATATSRLRGRAGRRIATTIIAAATLGLGLTACGPDSGADAAGSSKPPASASQDASQDSSSSTPPAGGGSQGKNGGQNSTAPSAAPAGSKAPEGGGHAQAGNKRLIVGKLEYMAPGKLIVKPDDGGMDQAFFVATDTTVLGAAAICSDEGGNVAIGDDGYGTRKCTLDDLEKAAKTGSVTVRVAMDTKTGTAQTVEEKYHP